MMQSLTRWGETCVRSLKVLRKGGIIVSMLEQPRPELMEQYGVKAIGQLTQVNSERLSKLAELVDQRVIKVNVGKTFLIFAAPNFGMWMPFNPTGSALPLSRGTPTSSKHVICFLIFLKNQFPCILAEQALIFLGENNRFNVSCKFFELFFYLFFLDIIEDHMLQPTDFRSFSTLSKTILICFILLTVKGPAILYIT